MPTVLNTIRVLAHNGPVRIELARWDGRLVVTKRVMGLSPEAASRLGREAHVAGRLNHPSIVRLLAVKGDTLVYEYCPGVNLAELIDQVRISLDRIQDILAGILGALEFAHDHGVIHLDVKPSNILIRGRQAMLTDFGFAKDLALANITSEHALMGTPGYMAPEQFRGVRDDPRSDIFGAAAVIHHMLTGRPPYGGDALRFLVGDETVRLHPLGGELSAFQDVLSRALAREADERHQTVREFDAELSAAFPLVSIPA